MRIATRPSFARKPDLVHEPGPPIGTGLEVRYRLPLLPRLLLGMSVEIFRLQDCTTGTLACSTSAWIVANFWPAGVL